MAKKDFSGVNTRSVYNQIADATAEPDQQEEQQAQEAQKKPRKTYTEQEQQQFKAIRKTQGRKGCFVHRINMAFSEEVHQYIIVMSRIRGETITDFTNKVIEQHMKENQAVYDQAKKILGSF